MDAIIAALISACAIIFVAFLGTSPKENPNKPASPWQVSRLRFLQSLTLILLILLGVAIGGLLVITSIGFRGNPESPTHSSDPSGHEAQVGVQPNNLALTTVERTVELDKYCQHLGHAGVTRIADDVRGWRCIDKFVLGNLHSIDMFDVCQWTYGRGTPIFFNAADAFSWRCTGEST